MSGAQNVLNGNNGSPPGTNGSNGASLVNGNGNGNGSGHGYPRSGSGSSGSRLDERNLATLQRLNIEVGGTEMAQKSAKGTLLAGEDELQIITNVYGLNHKGNINVHSYHMLLAKITTNRTIPILAKRSLPDYAAVMRRHFYQEIMPLFCLQNRNFFGENMNDHLVDYGHTLYSFRELPIVRNADGKMEKLMQLSVDEAKTVTHNAGVSLSLKPTNVEFMAENFSGVCLDLDSYDASVLRFNELATSHYVAKNFKDHCMFNNNKTYFIDPTQYGYGANDSVELGNGKFLAIGAEKSVILIEGADGTYSSLSGTTDRDPKPVAAVAVDSKKSPFYMPVLLADVICKVLKIRRNDIMTDAQIATLQPMFKQLTCHRTYGNSQKSALVMKRLTNVTPSEQTIVTAEYGTETIEQYFLRKYEKTLECPNWPLVEMRFRGASTYFPIELLKIADYQRVKVLSSNDIREVIKACAVLPHRKLEEVQRSIRAFNINGDSVCQNAGISVTEEPVKVTARILTPPSINYSNGIVTPVDGRWPMPKAGKYVSASDCKNWVAVLIDYQFPRPYDLEVFQTFCRESFVVESRLRGITIAEPHDILKIKPTDEALEKLFEDARLADIEYILFCHPDEETALHDHIKTFERKFMIVTQCIRTSTVDKIVHGQSKLSLENVIAKTNVKLGGHNYSIVLNDFALDAKTLFIGFGMNHPGSGFGKNSQQDDSNESAVSILGYSANDSKIAGSFVGNFYTTKLYEDNHTPVISEIIDEILGRFLRNRGYPPSRVIIYRSGCSEGQYQRVLKYELPVYLHFVKKYSPKAPVSVIVPSKMHNVRFFRKNIDPADRAPAQNIPPGAVMDNTIVHPKYMEFYLNSHVAIQGTAKTPRYTILFTSERHATLDVFQRWTNALCYGYQIVNSPVSVPAPVYIANCYAERGRQIANNLRLTHLTAAQHQMGLEISDEVRPDEAKDDYVKRSLKYNFSCRPDLRNRRINA